MLKLYHLGIIFVELLCIFIKEKNLKNKYYGF